GRCARAVVAPVGAGRTRVRENVSVCPASGSEGVAVKENGCCSLIVLSPIAARTGGLPQPEQTAIWIASKSLRGGEPLSVARTVTGNVPAELGVQLNAPVEAPMIAPEGAPASRENTTEFTGMSASVAVAVKVTGAPTAVALFPIAARIGATFTSFTVMVMASTSLSDGHPLS